MRYEVFHVLQEKSPGAMAADDVRNIEEQRSLRFVPKARFPSETVFFRHSGDGKRLAWEACTQYVKRIWDFLLCFFLCDVAERNFSKVGSISLLGIHVPL